MARRYQRPKCVAIMESGGVCGHEMNILGERHPAALHHRQNKVYVFQCPYCGALQGVDEDKLDRYFVRA